MPGLDGGGPAQDDLARVARLHHVPESSVMAVGGKDRDRQQGQLSPGASLHGTPEDPGHQVGPVASQLHQIQRTVAHEAAFCPVVARLAQTALAQLHEAAIVRHQREGGFLRLAG